jgi:hypothetical protein
MLSHDQLPVWKEAARYVLWPLVSEGSHELVEELLLLGCGDLFPAGTHVQRVLTQRLVVGAQVECEGQSRVRLDTSTGRVQGQLAHGNAHAVHAEISETQNTGAVGQDGDVDLVWPVVEDLAEVAAVAERQVHALGLCPDLVPSYAGLANGRGVYEGREFLGTSVVPSRDFGPWRHTLMFWERTL